MYEEHYVKFMKELKSFKSGVHISPGRKLYHLDAFLDKDGIIKVGGGDFGILFSQHS